MPLEACANSRDEIYKPPCKTRIDSEDLCEKYATDLSSVTQKLGILLAKTAEMFVTTRVDTEKIIVSRHESFGNVMNT